MKREGKAAIVVLGLGVVAGAVFFVTRVTEAPEVPEIPGLMIPTPSDILAARTWGELETWYIYIGQLLVTRTIDSETYDQLYEAYGIRFYQLTGWQE